MIDPELARFLEGPVMILVATRGAHGQPAIARGLGCRVDGGDELVLNVAARQWGEALAGLSPGDPVAVTFVRPADYRAVQVKGPLLAMAPGDPAAEARAVAYRTAMNAELLNLGVAQAQVDQWVDLEPLQALRVRVAAAFDQTPGAAAGRMIAGAAA